MSKNLIAVYAPYGILVLVLVAMRFLASEPLPAILVLTLTLAGAGLALWLAWQSLLAAYPQRRQHARHGFLAALAYSTLGLATSAGLATTLYLLLVGIMFTTLQQRNQALHGSGFLPFAATILAIWLAIGAALAAVSPLLAAIYWLAGMLWCLGILLDQQSAINPQVPWQAFWLLALGLFTPQLFHYLVLPLVGQFQAGLTAYGNLSAARWVGIEITDATSSVVAAMPLILFAGLVVVLMAGCIVADQLWPAPQGEPTAAEPLERTEILCRLAAEVPWLPQEHPNAHR
jgi:hypothetical protein